MKRKIYSGMCLISLIAVILSTALVLLTFYQSSLSAMRREAASQAVYISGALNQLEDSQSYLEKVGKDNPDIRLTLIARDGTVLFDNQVDPSQMENHLSRPEVSSAMKTGYAHGERLSATMSQSLFYYAIRLDDGTVLRLALSGSSALETLVSSLPLITGIVIVVLLIALIISIPLSRRIVQPINQLDLEHPNGEEVYDELSPLLHRIETQNHQIAHKIAELRESQREFNMVTENLREGLVILNRSAVILSMNSAAASLLSADDKSHTGEPFLQITRSIPLQRAINKALEGRQAEEILPIGSQTYHISISPVTSKNEVTGAILLFLDVTQQHMAETMRREFTANVSHELKTPLTSIVGYAELLENGMARPEDLKNFAGRIRGEAQRMINLVEDTIKLSQLDEGNIDAHKQDVDLQKLAQETIGHFSKLAEENEVSLHVTGQNVVVRAVPAMMGELIGNLVENAIKYNKTGGSVTIDTLKSETGIVLSVSDTGAGIPPEHQSRIFERFYRVDKSHSRQTGGTGLGLSIVKHIAQYHGATVSLVSQPGRGSTFTVRFPSDHR